MNTHETRIKQMKTLEQLHTALVNALPNADAPMRAELEDIGMAVMDMRQRAGSAVDIT